MACAFTAQNYLLSKIFMNGINQPFQNPSYSSDFNFVAQCVHVRPSFERPVSVLGQRGSKREIIILHTERKIEPNSGINLKKYMIYRLWYHLVKFLYVYLFVFSLWRLYNRSFMVINCSVAFILQPRVSLSFRLVIYQEICILKTIV